MKQPQETHYASPFGDIELHRFPKEPDPTLRAWSAADDYLLQQIKNLETKPQRILVANDMFGALAIGLSRFNPTSWSDSYISEQALLRNQQRNTDHIGDHRIEFVPADHGLAGPFDLVVMQLPKSHRYLHYQLERLKPHLTPDATLLAGTMVKHFHPNVLRYFEDSIGPTHTSLARKKARLIIAHNDVDKKPTAKELVEYANRYPLETDNQTELFTLPNVFSFEQLDIGTRALLPHIPGDPSLQNITDLGCGNGALGIQAARLNPKARITFCDESYLAIASAKMSATGLSSEHPPTYLVTDTLHNAPQNQDLILCNPPFHQQTSMHKGIALRMFKQSHRHLASGGKLLLVANRHLRYQQSLRQLFAHVNLVARNKKFVVLEALKS